jgi:hypothetical protein
VEVRLFDSTGQQVTLPSTNRPSLASGTVWDGRYPGQMLLPGSMAYGQYQVRATATAGAKATTYVLGTISYPNPNPPAQTVSPSVPASTSPSPSSGSDTASASIAAVSVDNAGLSGALAIPGVLLLWLYAFVTKRREEEISKPEGLRKQ